MTCAGCGTHHGHFGVTTVRWAGRKWQLCIGQGDQPKAECTRRFAVRAARLCWGCKRGELSDPKVAHRLHGTGNWAQGLCKECQRALKRGRAALKADDQEHVRRKSRRARIVGLSKHAFVGYAEALAAVIATGKVWPSADAADAPTMVSVHPPDADQGPHAAVETTLPLRAEDLGALRGAIDALVQKAYKKGMERGESLLKALADGRYTVDEFDDSWARRGGYYD